LYTEGTIKTETDLKRKITGRRKTKTTLMIIAVIFAILVIAAFYSGLVVRRYGVTTDKLNPGQSIRIVLISDLHSCIYGENQKDIVSLIKKQEPDMIALAGDIADDEAPVIGTELFLANIKDIAPIYYVTGNHEFLSRDVESIKEMIRRYGVTVLEHEYERTVINGIPLVICGVDDPEIQEIGGIEFDWRQEMYSAFAGLENIPGYKILLAHRPEFIGIYKKFGFDLILSGHTHGGQVRIPFFLNGLYAPGQGWFPRYAGGVYEHGSLVHVISRGVSYNPKLPRIFNPPEVTVIDIVGDAGIT